MHSVVLDGTGGQHRPKTVCNHNAPPADLIHHLRQISGGDKRI